MELSLFELIDEGKLISEIISKIFIEASYFVVLIFGLGYLIKSRGHKANYRNLTFLVFSSFGMYLLVKSGFNILDIFRFNTNNIYSILVNAISKSFLVFSLLNFTFLIKEELRLEFNKFLIAKAVLLIFAATIVQNIFIQL